MAIVKLKPTCKDYLWGGDRLIKEYNKDFSGTRLAETWELSCHPDGPSFIASGPDAGMTLSAYIEKHERRILGANCQIFQEFPIIAKFIDARDDLSIQVHPNNMDAVEKEHQYGKSEMWYVLEADPGAYLYYGFTHPITKEEYRRRIEENTLEEVLNAVPVKKGDLFYIPAGTVHAICKGIVIAEIQQNSNVTYRVYDHGRVGPDGKPRQLHIDKAVEVSKLELPCTKYNFGGHLVRSAYFTVDRFDAPCQISTDEESFTSLLVLDGAGAVSCGDDVLQCKKGDSLFITADSGMSYLSGNLQVLCTRIGTI